MHLSLINSALFKIQMWYKYNETYADSLFLDVCVVDNVLFVVGVIPYT